MSDFTYLKANFKTYYLCAIMDLFSRKIIDCKLSNKIDTQLAIDTLNLAIANRGVSNGIMFHTDRGSQYTAKTFRKHVDKLNMIQSFSAKCHPYDNTVMECFFKYLKKEETNRRSYSSTVFIILSILILITMGSLPTILNLIINNFLIFAFLLVYFIDYCLLPYIPTSTTEQTKTANVGSP